MKSMRKSKAVINNGLSVLLLMGVLKITSCGDDPISESERVASLLTAHTWKVFSVMVDNVSQSNLYTNFAITFTATGFTTTNGEPVWPASGTWTFKNENTKIITRGDGIEMKLSEINEATLKLELTWNKTTIGSGRISSIAGVHVFSLVK